MVSNAYFMPTIFSFGTMTPKKKLVPLTEKLLNQPLISLEKWCVVKKLTSQKHIMKSPSPDHRSCENFPIDAMLLCTGICH
ncbi:hypothetical protein CEXT_673901 [Caerostris extrusa]|uniref:Uncharacterized protein n=1 Tax=Caerostris extrusa TaxID=172846 RepID=A0AAV4X357_CAEEX|nr:hypothetical protein CEXT_673901 [Caerostris extrusa]